MENLNRSIQMVDLHGQYLRFKQEIDEAMQTVIDSCAFINGPQVKQFASNLAEFLQVPSVTTCGNGTDALQIALMALKLQPGDEVILPAFTYIAAAEVVALLGLTPVLVDVDKESFNILPEAVEAAVSEKTKAIVAVHLFGQTCNMEPLMEIARNHHLYVVEDNAQSLGADYCFSDGSKKKAGTIGDIGTTSFFPSKPLACYGDGGAVFSSNEELASRIHKIANHGQEKKYHHQLIGCNSRLDTLQAALLNIKLQHLTEFNQARQEVAERYDRELSVIPELKTPGHLSYSTHIYHQYTLQVKKGLRDVLQLYLKSKGIPSMVYYPLPIHHQEAYIPLIRISGRVVHAEELCKSVLSLPIHTEMDTEQQEYIISCIKEFFTKEP